MKKILHIMRNEKFTCDIAKFYDRFYSSKGHEILYILSDSKSIINHELKIKQSEISYLDINKISGIRKLKQKLLRYDKIVLHSLYFRTIFLLLFLINKDLLHKTIWIEWGGDLYDVNVNSKTISSKLKDRILHKLKFNIGSVVCIFPPDIDFYRRNYDQNTNQKVFYAPYWGLNEYNSYKEYKSFSNAKNNTSNICIQIGNSANPELNHLKIIEELSRFKNENITLFLPLSYGNMEYADYVEKYSRKVFGNNVIILRKMLPKDEYFKILNNVDIAIFYSDRQIALANIVDLVFKNKKMYLKENSALYTYFTSNNLPVYSFDNIENMTFEELVEYNYYNYKNELTEFFKNYSDENLIVNYWDNVYESI